jgi:hypothetical protein
VALTSHSRPDQTHGGGGGGGVKRKVGADAAWPEVVSIAALHDAAKTMA